MVAWLDGCTRITEEKLGAELYWSSVTSVKSLAKNEKNENFRQKTEVPFYFVRAEVIIFPSMLHLTLNESWKSRFS